MSELIKVWVLLRIWPEEVSDICGIYSTREKAEHVQDMSMEVIHDGSIFSIEEWDVDKSSWQGVR